MMRCLLLLLLLLPGLGGCTLTRAWFLDLPEPIQTRLSRMLHTAAPNRSSLVLNLLQVTRRGTQLIFRQRHVIRPGLQRGSMFTVYVRRDSEVQCYAMNRMRFSTHHIKGLQKQRIGGRWALQVPWRRVAAGRFLVVERISRQPYRGELLLFFQPAFHGKTVYSELEVDVGRPLSSWPLGMLQGGKELQRSATRHLWRFYDLDVAHLPEGSSSAVLPGLYVSTADKAEGLVRLISNRYHISAAGMAQLAQTATNLGGGLVSARECMAYLHAGLVDSARSLFPAILPGTGEVTDIHNSADMCRVLAAMLRCLGHDAAVALPLQEQKEGSALPFSLPGVRLLEKGKAYWVFPHSVYHAPFYVPPLLRGSKALLLCGGSRQATIPEQPLNSDRINLWTTASLNRDGSLLLQSRVVFDGCAGINGRRLFAAGSLSRARKRFLRSFFGTGKFQLERFEVKHQRVLGHRLEIIVRARLQEFLTLKQGQGTFQPSFLRGLQGAPGALLAADGSMRDAWPWGLGTGLYERLVLYLPWGCTLVSYPGSRSHGDSRCSYRRRCFPAVSKPETTEKDKKAAGRPYLFFERFFQLQQHILSPADRKALTAPLERIEQWDRKIVEVRIK